jgi:hypothetical protein
VQKHTHHQTQKILICHAFKSHVEVFLEIIKITNYKNHLQMCKYCGKNIDFEKLLNNIDLRTHIINDKSYMKFVSMFNKIKESFIVSRLSFTQFFQLKGYRQYDMHGSVVNAPTNLNLVQKLLP